MVRISSRRLIELQRQALRARELEVEVRRLQAEERARRLLMACESPLEASLELLSDLPLTVEGRLHDQAFLELVEAQVWADRERALAALTATD